MAPFSILTDAGMIPDNVYGKAVSGDITSDTTWKKTDNIMLAGQVYVKSGATLTIEKGTTIKSYKRATSSAGTGLGGLAPAVVIEKGAKINAAGTSSVSSRWFFLL